VGWGGGGGEGEVAGGGRKRRPSAFLDDWMEYEAGGSRGGIGMGMMAGGGRRNVRRPAVGGTAGHVAPYSPYERRGGGEGGEGGRRSHGGVGAVGTGGPPSTASSSTSSTSTAAQGLSAELAERLLPSLSNPPSTVRLGQEDAADLSDGQRAVVESVLSGHSTFFTGPAGSGKSHVLSTILRLDGTDGGSGGGSDIGIGGRRRRRYVLTATTGISACNVGGVTVHSFAGVGTGDGPLPDLLSRVMGNERARRRWRDVDVLIIDEVSMMPGQFLDRLDAVAQRARNDPRPFGGIQLLLCGDFYQLPPVNLARSSFAFEARCWGRSLTSSVLLTRIYRQGGDARLRRILNEARIGELSDESAEILRAHSVENPASGGGGQGGVRPTLLEPRNAQVDRANLAEMGRLPGKVRSFRSRDRSATEAYGRQLQHCQAPSVLDLKVGAQVLLLKNLDPGRGLVNGSRGVVVDFRRARCQADLAREFRGVELPVVRFPAAVAVGERDGTGRDEGDGDEGDGHGHGHGHSAGNAAGNATGKSATAPAPAPGADADGDADGCLEVVIEPAEWTNKVGDVTVSSRQQIPLRLAWALSVHKSQGMTIPHLAVSLRGVFEYGQAYVALSRSTRLDLLTLRGFDRRAFRAHPKVKEFYRLLEGGGGRGRAPGGTGGVPKGAAREGPQAQELPPPPRTYARQATALVATTNYSGARSSSLSSKSPPRNLTDGQRSRMEENRRRALARKQQKQAAGAGGGPANPYAAGAGVPPPSASSRSSSSSGGRTTPPPRNPYAR